MILGIGTDIIAIKRIEGILLRHPTRFITRVFAQQEQLYPYNDPRAAHHYAKRFAAKEATAKALGFGIDQGIYLKDIIIENNAYGAPQLHLVGKAARHAAALNQGVSPRLHVSLSDDEGLALAFVVIEGKFL